MKIQSWSKFTACAMAAALMGLASAGSYAARSVRTDASDSAFDFLGGFWGTDNQQFGVSAFDAGRTDFRLKISPKGSPRFFNVCMGEGFIKLINADLACADADFAGPPTDSYIAVFAADLDSSSGRWVRTRGFVDTAEPYKLPQAEPATRFWWSSVTLAGDGTFQTFDIQIVLIDRSKGTNNGDFDVELNYGNGGGGPIPPVPSADGFQGLQLGPNLAGPVFGPFTDDGVVARYCFRGGKKRACC